MKGSSASRATRRPACWVLLGLFLTGMSVARAQSGTTAADDLNFAVWDQSHLLRVQVSVTLDGVPVGRLWDELWQDLVQLTDRDADGSLDPAEARRLPTPISLRQMLWGQFAARPGTLPAWETLDLDGNQRLSVDEVRSYYRRLGVGQVVVGFGRCLASAQLTAALTKFIDTDADQRLTEAEWQAAAARLSQLDQNEDELTGPGELLEGLIYPGVSGTLLLAAPVAGQAVHRDLTQVPLLMLADDRDNTAWAAVLAQKLDQNGDSTLSGSESRLEPAAFAELDQDQSGSLTPQELVGWRNLPAAAVWQVQLGEETRLVHVQAGEPQECRDANGLQLNTPTLRWSLRTDPGRLPAAAREALERIEARFVEADQNRDEAIDEMEAKTSPQLEAVVSLADKDGDQRVSRSEFAAWHAWQVRAARAQVLLTLRDHGPGLFELLDADHDGGLSQREQREMWSQLQAAGCVLQTAAGEAYVSAETLPRQLRATVSPGHPQSPLGTILRSGPAWFVPLDRNRDGDVSLREFNGAPETFHRLDTNQDGLIDAAEARQATPAE